MSEKEARFVPNPGQLGRPQPPGIRGRKAIFPHDSRFDSAEIVREADCLSGRKLLRGAAAPKGFGVGRERVEYRVKISKPVARVAQG